MFINKVFDISRAYFSQVLQSDDLQSYQSKIFTWIFEMPNMRLPIIGENTLHYQRLSRCQT